MLAVTHFAVLFCRVRGVRGALVISQNVAGATMSFNVFYLGSLAERVAHGECKPANAARAPSFRREPQRHGHRQRGRRAAAAAAAERAVWRRLWRQQQAEEHSLRPKHRRRRRQRRRKGCASDFRRRRRRAARNGSEV